MAAELERQLNAATAAQSSSRAPLANEREDGESDVPRGKDGRPPKKVKSRFDRAAAIDFLDDGEGSGDPDGDPEEPGDDGGLFDEGSSDSSDDDDVLTSLQAKSLAKRLLTAGAFAHCSGMPSAARKTYELALAYRGKRLKNHVDLLAQNESGNMPLECAVAIIKGKYVDFGKVYAHEPGKVSVEQVASSRDDLFVARPAPSATIPDAHSFLVVYDKVAVVTARVYPHRVKELSDYRRWFSGQVLARPDLFHSYREYDETYRKNLDGDGYGWTLLDAKNDTAALFRHLQPRPHGGGGGGDGSSSTRVRARSPSSSGAGPSRTKQRYSYDYAKEVCGRYNERIAHDVATCKAMHPPRRHICAAWGAGGHGRLDPTCPRAAGGGSGARGRADGAPPQSLRK